MGHQGGMEQNSKDTRRIMRIPPESFLIFKEELKKEKLEKEKLQKQYDEVIKSLNEEFCILKEQISSQQDMIRRTVEYAMKLEKEISNLKEKMDSDLKNSKRSYH